MIIKTQVDSELSHATTNVENFEFLNETIRDRIDVMAKLYPNDVPFVFEQNGGLKLTYTELKRRVETMAQNLLSLGFQKGDRFAFQLPNTVETLISTLACAYIGVISVAIDPTWINSSNELEYLLEKVKPSGLVLMTSFNGLYFYNLFRDISENFVGNHDSETSHKFSFLKHVFLARTLENFPLVQDPSVDYSNLRYFEEVLNENANLGSVKHQLPHLDPHDPVFLSFTSGTTGRYKAPISSFFKYANNVKSTTISLDDSISWLNNCCNVFAMHHAACRLLSIIPNLLSNTAQTVFPSFVRNIPNTLETIEKHQCRTLIGPPLFLLNLFASPLFDQFDTSSIEYVVGTAQIITPDLVEKAFEKFKNLKYFIVLFGMSEFLIASIFPIDDPKMCKDLTSLSIGKPLPFFQFKIVDPKSGLTLPSTQKGELYIKNSFSTFIGYWQEPDKTKEAFTDDGWYKTGDMAQIDESGYVYYKNRHIDVITIGNIQYFPCEIEALLRMHENVFDANVFSINVNGNENRLCAWVILKDKSKIPSVDEMKEICGTMPLKYVKFVNEFIVSSVNKVLKTEMAKIYKKELNL